MWKRKKLDPVPVPDDLHEAISMRAQASEELRELENQAPAVQRLSSYLSERRQLNHFGDSIQITFTRRGHA